MRLRDWLPSRSRQAAPEQTRGAVARAPEWPRVSPLQRSLTAPSLVTDPDGFRRRLSTWDNPSFLDAPGHLLSSEAPSGSVSGLAVSRTRSEGSVLPARQEWGSPVGSESSTTAVQLSAVDSVRALPATTGGAGPWSGAPDRFVSAAAAPVPPPVPRPAVPGGPGPALPVPPSPSPPTGGGPSEDVVVVQRQAVDDDQAPPAAPDGHEPESFSPAHRPIPDPVTVADGAAAVETPPGPAPRTPTLGSPLRTVSRAAVPDAAAGGAVPEKVADGPGSPAVQRLASSSAVQPGAGRRRLGLGAPLPSTPPPVPPVPDLPSPAPPALTPPPAVQRLGLSAPVPSPAPRVAAPVRAPSAVQRVAAHVETAPAVERVATPAVTRPAAGPAPDVVVRASGDDVAGGGDDISTVEVPEAPVQRSGDAAPALPLAARYPEPVEDLSVATLGADPPGSDLLTAVAPPQARQPAGVVGAGRASPVQRAALPGVASSSPAGEPSRRPAVQRSSAQTDGATEPPADVAPAAGHAAATSSAAESGPAPADLHEEASSPRTAPAPTLPADGTPTALVGDAAPLPAPGWPTPGVQREKDGRQNVASGHRPSWTSPSAAPTVSGAGPRPGVPAAGAQNRSPVGVQSLAAAAPQAMTVGPTPPAWRAAEVRVPAATQPDGADGSDASADVPWLPERGSAVGAVGSRPVQRQVVGMPAPDVHRPPEPAWPSADPAGRERLQRTIEAPTVTGAFPQAFGRPASPLPPPVQAAWRMPAVYRPVPMPVAPAGVPVTVAAEGRVPVQTLVSLDDLPGQPTIPPAPAVVPTGAAPYLPGGVSSAVPPPMAELSDPGGARLTGEATAAAGPAPAAPAAADVDALVRRLYDPLARRLRAELRLDRERVGRALDLRH